MNQSPSLKERFRYWMDNIIAKGNLALFLSLILTLFGAIVFIAFLRWASELLLPEWNTGFVDHIWLVFLQLTDPGNLGEDTEAHQALKLPGIIACLSGLIIFSALVAVITTALDGAIERLREGHSRVIETGHTLILGWSDRVAEIIRELIEANESESRPCITILADRPKHEMDDEIKRTFADTGNTRIVTRSGSSASLLRLQQINAHAARSAIILAECRESDSAEKQIASDAKVIKSVLALEAIAEDATFPIVTEVFNQRNADLVKDIGPHRVHIVDAAEILAKLIVQTSRTSGLSIVYSELLSFFGCELYFHQAKWSNTSWDELPYHFRDGVPIGVRNATQLIVLRPPLDYRLTDDDEVLILAEDDSTIYFSDTPHMRPKVVEVPERKLERGIESMLLIGWSPKSPVIIREYAGYVLPGSKIEIVLNDPVREWIEQIELLQQELSELTINIRRQDPLDEDALRSLDLFSFNNVLVIPQNPSSDKNAEQIDTETLLLLLVLRKIKRTSSPSKSKVQTKIVTEVLNSQNHALVDHAGVDDFVISNRMISMLFAQISEEPTIANVYNNLFQEEGSEIYLKPVELYFDHLPKTLTFGELIRFTQGRDAEICLGWREKTSESDANANHGIRLNPHKEDTITLQAGDSLIVVSEDDT